MKLTLITGDQKLRGMVREILHDCPTAHWELVAAESAVPGDSGFWVWDYQPESPLPADLAWAHGDQHLFLVRPEDLGKFSRRIPCSDVGILLKPVTRTALSAFLTQAGFTDGGLELRSDMDEILQAILQTDLRLQVFTQAGADFLARAAEDFKTPVTVMSGYCGLLATEPLGSISEDQKEALERMQQSAKRLARLASAVFEMRTGGPAENLRWQKGDLRECLEEVLDEIVPIAEEKRIEISLDFYPSPEPLHFEKSQMEQVLSNLLENACKFTPRFGSIEIRGYPFFWERRLGSESASVSWEDRRRRDSEAPNAFRFDVRDSGPAIQPEQQDFLFEEHAPYTGGADRSGGGLGLAICKWILRRHHGHIWAESGAHGTVFSFVLPFRIAAAMT